MELLTNLNVFMKRLTVLFFLLLGMISASANAQTSVGEKGTLSGLFFGDYYWFANHFDQNIEGNNGFWIRRVYLTYERDISDAFSARLRLEMAHEGDFQGSDISPTVKDAYLKWQNEDHEIYAGISSTPTFDLTEDIWGYRSVEKSPLDLYDFGSSRDVGIAFKGSLAEADKMNYHLFVGNGNGEGADFNRGKKVMLALTSELTEQLVVQVYGDWDNSYEEGDTYTLQGLIGYRSDTFNFGALYAHQLRETSGLDLELDLISVFTNFALSEKLTGFLRADHLFDPYIGGDENAYLPFRPDIATTFLVGGVDIALHEDVSLMPNVEAILYGQNPLQLDSDADIIPRMTLMFEF